MNKFLKIIIILSMLGILLSLFIYITDVYSISGICPTEGCATVAASEYSKILSIPVSLLGVSYYVGVAFIAMVLINKPEEKLFKLLLPTSIIVGIIFTIYLRYVEIFKIGSICIWCWGSVLIIIGLCISYYLFEKNSKNPLIILK